MKAILVRAFALVERDAQRCALAIVNRLALFSIRIAIDDNVAVVRAVAHRIVVLDPSAAISDLAVPEVKLTVASEHVLPLLDGIDHIYSAVIANRLRVRCAPQHAPALFDTVKLFIEGCARSPDGPALLSQLRQDIT